MKLFSSIVSWLMVSALSLCILTPANAETLLERGTYLVESIAACGNCHTHKFGPMEGKEFAGGFPFKEGFEAYAANITSDKETGIGKWTDAQLIKAIREGKRPDGSTLGPPMPFDLYSKLSDRDVKAIVAYIRKVKAVNHKVPKSKYPMPLPPQYGPPVGNVTDIPSSDKIAYGEYLTGPVGHCVECHTPMVKPGHFDYENQFAAGGFPFKGPWGLVVSANLTPDKQTGLGNWTDQQIKDAITKGVGVDGSKLKGPMPFSYYAKIKTSDLDAIVAYLRSIKPIKR